MPSYGKNSQEKKNGMEVKDHGFNSQKAKTKTKLGFSG